MTTTNRTGPKHATLNRLPSEKSGNRPAAPASLPKTSENRSRTPADANEVLLVVEKTGIRELVAHTDAVDDGNWYNLSPEDGYAGTSADKAYAHHRFPKRPPADAIIEAVIDSGVDIGHEDLGAAKDAQGNLLNPSEFRVWTNADEAAGAEDADKNGFKGDVHGVSFLGYVKDGKPVNIGRTTLECTREKARMEKLKSERPLTPEEQAYLKEVNALYNEAKSSGRPAEYTDLAFNPRVDDITDYSDRSHYNTDVTGPNARHGTHCGCLSVGWRDNGKHGRGLSTCAVIMPVRAVPDGDEYDKDIANAIRYAVDNGAKVISMSFGKPLSPGKQAVDEAFLYAAAHDVVLVHAAGNDAKDLDDPTKHNYPSRYLLSDPSKEIPGWLEIGASGPRANENLPAPFTNHGETYVDGFAPGVKVLAGIPYNDQSALLSGTSMATPIVAGMIDDIRYKFPILSAVEVVEVMNRSVRTYPDLMVFKPGTQEKVPFSSLSRTGGVYDLDRALDEAARVAKNKKARLAYAAKKEAAKVD